MKTIGNYTSQNPSQAVVGLSIAIALLCTLLQLTVGERYAQGFDFLQPFPIRIAASQFVHLSWNHLLPNLAGLFIIVWGFAGNSSVRAFATNILLGSIWIGLYLTWLEPLSWYCGLSGLLHLLFTMYLYQHWRAIGLPVKLTSQWPLLLLSVGLLLKMVLEGGGYMPSPENLGGPIAYEAHRAGVLGGLVVGMLTEKHKH